MHTNGSRVKITCAGSAKRLQSTPSFPVNIVMQLRKAFLSELFTQVPSLQVDLAELTETEFLKAMIYPRATIALTAKFMHDVLEVFYAVPVLRVYSRDIP